MSNSSLVNHVALSPNKYGKRKYPISRISPHCTVGQLSVETIGNIFATTSRQASCNYGIGADGRVVLVVDESEASWCTSDYDNDERAVTIECASDNYDPYAFNDTVYNKLIELCADICKRNGKTKLLWIADRDTSLAYQPSANEMVLTVHRWFKNKACPGDWMMARMDDLANKVNAKLNPPFKSPKIVKNAIYRLYNPNTGEHFFTANPTERDNLIKSGWTYEGVAWKTDGKGDGITRLYNKTTGDHFYTMSAAEIKSAKGYKKEGVVFASSKNKKSKIYRLYNGKYHMYTKNKAEKEQLVKAGWKYECVAFYGD